MPLDTMNYLIYICIVFIINHNLFIMKNQFKETKRKPIAKTPKSKKTYDTGNHYRNLANKTLYPELKATYEAMARGEDITLPSSN